MAQILYRGNCEMNLYAYVKMCSCFIVYIIVRQKIGTVALSLCVCLIRWKARFLDYVCVLPEHVSSFEGFSDMFEPMQLSTACSIIL